MWHKIWVLTEAASAILVSAPQAAQLLAGGNTTARGGTMAAPNVAGFLRLNSLRSDGTGDKDPGNKRDPAVPC